MSIHSTAYPKTMLLAALGLLLLVIPGCAWYYQNIQWYYCKGLGYPGLLSCIQPPPADSATLLRFGEVPYPEDNKPTKEKEELGKKLFFDPLLSSDSKSNHTIRCASCHMPDKGFADGLKFPIGIDGKEGDIHAPTVLNTAYNRHLFWDGRVGSLEEQALKPIENDKEMGRPGNLKRVVEDLNKDPDYTARFKKVFGTGVTTEGIAKAIATYERTLVSKGTPFERWVMEEEPMSKAAQRGWKVFEGKGRCANCHVPPTYTDDNFHNIGVLPVPGKPMNLDLNGFLSGSLQKHPDPDYVRDYKDHEKYRMDKCAFKTPSLLNIAETAPYMHTGVFSALDQVVSFYMKGGDDNSKDCGQKDWRMEKLDLSLEEQRDLIEFVKSLSGTVPPGSLP